MPDYVEASEKRNHSDQRLYRNYGSRIYDSPAWTDDVYGGAFQRIAAFPA
jgi:hypothetical protein